MRLIAQSVASAGQPAGWGGGLGGGAAGRDPGQREPLSPALLLSFATKASQLG